MRKLLLLILLLSSFKSNSQATSAVTLSAKQAAKIQDSLRVLPLVRQEAQQWQLASAHYQQAADSLRQAFRLQQDIGQSYQKSMSDQQQLLTSETAAKTEWRSKARKRGVVNVLLTALVGTLTYLTIAH